MKHFAPLLALCLAASATAQVPKVFEGLLEKDVPVRAQIGVVVPPEEINKFVAKVEKAAKEDTKWFREFSAQAKPGAPLPFHDKLGLTQEEYQEYLKLWAAREFKGVEDIMLLLRESSGGTWSITATGTAGSLTTLRYVTKDDVFRSPNGSLKRIDDIKADEASILGEWTGSEWKFEEETGLGKTKENIAVGRFSDKKYGLVVYRVQELSTEGTRLLDKSLVIRFALGKAGHLPAKTPAKGQPPVEPTPKPKLKK